MNKEYNRGYNDDAQIISKNKKFLIFLKNKMNSLEIALYIENQGSQKSDAENDIINGVNVNSTVLNQFIISNSNLVY